MSFLDVDIDLILIPLYLLLFILCYITLDGSWRDNFRLWLLYTALLNVCVVGLILILLRSLACLVNHGATLLLVLGHVPF